MDEKNQNEENDLEIELAGSSEVLFELTAETNPQTVAELDKLSENLSTIGKVSTPWREPSEITIGDAQPFSVAELYKKAKQPLPAEAQILLKTHDLCLVYFSCSATPAPETRFTNLKFEVQLTTTYPAGSPETEEAMAIDLFPDNIQDEIKVSKKSSISPQLTIKPKILMTEVEVGLKVGEVSSSEEYMVYVPRIESRGRLMSRLVWEFSPTKSHQLLGENLLVALIKKPKGSTVTAKYTLTVKNEIVKKRGPISAGLMNLFYRDKKKPFEETPDRPLC